MQTEQNTQKKEDPPGGTIGIREDNGKSVPKADKRGPELPEIRFRHLLHGFQKHLGQKQVCDQRKKKRDHHNGRRTDKEVADPVIKISRIAGMSDVAQYAVLRIDGKQADFLNPVPEQETGQRMRAFMDGRADNSRQHAHLAAVPAEIGIKPAVAPPDQEAE